MTVNPKPDLYKVKSRETGPVDDLLEAVVALNWHLSRARGSDWNVKLTVSPGGTLSVSIQREIWPTEESEREAMAEGLVE